MIAVTRGTRRDTHTSRSTGGTGAVTATGTGTTQTERRTPVTGQGAHGHERDTQNLREQQAQGEFYNERRREHRQGTEGSGDQNPVLRHSKSKPKEKAAVNKQKPSFKLSGALLEDTSTFCGIVISTASPRGAHPQDVLAYPFQNNEFLMFTCWAGVAAIPITHLSCSKQHAVLQQHLLEHSPAAGTAGCQVRPCITDLGSGSSTINNQRYYQLKERDLLKSGFSSREYTPLHKSSEKSEVNAKDSDEEKEAESDR